MADLGLEEVEMVSNKATGQLQNSITSASYSLKRPTLTHRPTCLHGTEEAQPSEAWFCASVQPQKQDCVKLHPCNSAQHLRKQGPPGFLRVFFAATLSLLLPVRCTFGAIACNVKHEQSTSELCRERQRSRVSERNPNGNLTASPPYSAKTPTRSDTKCWQAQWIPRFCGVSRPVE